MYFKKWMVGLLSVLLMFFIASCSSKKEESTKNNTFQPTQGIQQKEIQKPQEEPKEKEILFIVEEKQDPKAPYSDELRLNFQEIKLDGTGIFTISSPEDFSGNYSHKFKKKPKLDLDPSETSYHSWEAVDEKGGIVTVKSLKSSVSHSLNWRPDEFSDAPKFKKPAISPDGTKVVMYSEKDNTIYLTDTDGKGKELKKVLSKPEGQETKEGTIDAHPSILDIKILWLADSSKFICYELNVHYLERQPGQIVGKEIIEGFKFTVFDKSGNKLTNNDFSAPDSRLWIKEKYPDSSGYLCVLAKSVVENLIQRYEMKYVKLTAEGKIEFLNMNTDETKTDYELRAGPISPNCSKMVYSDEKNIWTVNLDGSESINLTDTKEDRKNYAPIWSPDGIKIAFASDVKNEQESQITEIWIMDADGGNKEKLTSEVPYSFIFLAWGKAKN